MSSAHPANDIALARMSEKLESFTDLARPACLPLPGVGRHLGADRKVAMSGWGTHPVDEGCGYAWYNKENKEWYHTPPTQVQGSEYDAF